MYILASKLPMLNVYEYMIWLEKNINFIIKVQGKFFNLLKFKKLNDMFFCIKR